MVRNRVEDDEAARKNRNLLRGDNPELLIRNCFSKAFQGGAAMVNESQVAFRIVLWRPWLLAVAGLALLGTLGGTVSLIAGQPLAALCILLVLAGAAVALLLPIGIAVRVGRWHVDPNGIGGRNHSLVYHRLDWSEIESVEPWLIPGYRYLQVNGVRRRWAFWLPLFFTDMPGFRSAVTQYAPPENPLRRYLEKHPA